MKIICIILSLFSGLLLLFSISQHNPSQQSVIPISGNASVNSDFKTLLMDSLLAEGFDFPVGNTNGQGDYTSLTDGKIYHSWYVATKTAEEYSLGIHTGEDWNGSGGGNTDLGQPVYATTRGKVIFSGECPSPWGNVILIQHRYLENNEIKTIYSQYAHVKELFVKKGQVVKKRQKIASIGQGNHQEYPAHLHFEIRKSAMADFAIDYWPSSNGKTVDWVKQHYESPTEFIKARRTLIVPRNEKTVVLVEKSKFKMHLFSYGKSLNTYEIALGQQPVGKKEIEGDLKVPEGRYRICEKTKGPFGKENWVNAYLGPRWLRLSYPNEFDAQEGIDKKRINRNQYESIVTSIKNNKIPPKNTGLGGGIGIHGWLESDWDNNAERALTWGCISMHNKDLESFFDKIDLNTQVIIVK